MRELTLDDGTRICEPYRGYKFRLIEDAELMTKYNGQSVFEIGIEEKLSNGYFMFNDTLEGGKMTQSINKLSKKYPYVRGGLYDSSGIKVVDYVLLDLRCLTGESRRMLHKGISINLNKLILKLREINTSTDKNNEQE